MHKQAQEDTELCGAERGWCLVDDPFEGGEPYLALFVVAGLLSLLLLLLAFPLGLALLLLALLLGFVVGHALFVFRRALCRLFLGSEDAAGGMAGGESASRCWTRGGLWTA